MLTGTTAAPTSSADVERAKPETKSPGDVTASRPEQPSTRAGEQEGAEPSAPASPHQPTTGTPGDAPEPEATDRHDVARDE